jgi:putative transposase
MTQANPLWGAPRIHGELLKLGIDISERTVSRLMPKNRKPPSQTWRTFLDNHFRELVSIDFLTVPTATFRVLYVLVVLAHDRRRVVHFNVTEHPTAAWTAQQMIEAFPEETAPRFLLRDRDRIYGEEFRRRVAGMRIEEVMTAPHSPWQSPYVERLIGSIRRECLDHVIVLGESHLRRILRSYIAYYNSSSQYSFVLCSLKYELFLRRIRYRPMPVMFLCSIHQLLRRWCLEVTTAKNPRPIGQWMFSLDLSSFYR